MAVTAGSYTVGPDGGDDYATWALADADTGTMTGDLTFTLNGNITDTAVAAWTGNDGGFILTLDSASPHGGDVTAGYLSICGHSSHLIAIIQSGGGSNVVKDLKLKRTVAGSAIGIYLILSSTDNSPSDCHNLFVDLNNLQGRGIGLSRKGASVLYNFVIWDSSNEGFIGLGGSSGSLTVENGGVRNCGEGIDNGTTTASYRDVWAFSNTTDWTNTTNATGNNLSATDTTAFGTDAHDSLTEADEVISTDDTNAEFAHLKTGGTNDEGGSAPTVATNDMAGTAYASPYPVGPFMPAAAPPAGGGGSWARWGSYLKRRFLLL